MGSDFDFLEKVFSEVPNSAITCLNWIKPVQPTTDSLNLSIQKFRFVPTFRVYETHLALQSARVEDRENVNKSDHQSTNIWASTSQNANTFSSTVSVMRRPYVFVTKKGGGALWVISIYIWYNWLCIRNTSVFKSKCLFFMLFVSVWGSRWGE